MKKEITYGILDKLRVGMTERELIDMIGKPRGKSNISYMVQGKWVKEYLWEYKTSVGYFHIEIGGKAVTGLRKDITLVKDMLKAREEAVKPGSPAWYRVTAISGAGEVLPGDILFRLRSSIEAEAFSALERDAKFKRLREAAEKAGKAKEHYIEDMDEFNVQTAPLEWLASQTGVPSGKLEKENGKRLFMTNETLQYNTFGKARTAVATVTYYFTARVE